jgi:hypothetical protein
MADTIDLRGQRVVAELAPVLADPTGRRARYLARAGRLIAVVLLLWLLGLLLAGIGILPTGDVPLGGSVASQAPRLHALPTPTTPSRADLQPARPVGLAAAAAATGSHRVTGASSQSQTRLSAGGSSAASPTSATGPGGAHPGAARGTRPGRGGAAPGPAALATVTPVAGGAIAPGQAATHSHTTGGNSASAPGHVRKTTSTTTTTTTTTPGRSGAAPGQTGIGHGHNG